MTAPRRIHRHTTDSARTVLELTARDFAHVVARGWLTAVAWSSGRGAGQQVPLYRHGDLTDLRDHPGIDWAAIRAVPAGRRSLIPTLPDPEGRT